MQKSKTFKEKAPALMLKLMAKFEIEDFMAAAVLGNLGHESDGLQALHERGQPEGKGGYGWGQWTGPRRRAFLHWCGVHDLDWKSDEANYGYLVYELEQTERGAVSALLKAKTLEDAVKAFERNYERAGVENMPSRERWARIALDAYQAAS